MNIHWYSPLDVTRTEIARFSHSLRPLLEEAFTLEVWSDCETVSEEAPPASGARPMSPINIYHVGNSSMHCEIVRFALQVPGIVVLHDSSLLELALAFARQRREVNLPDLVQRELGLEAVRAFNAMYSGPAYDWCGRDQSQYDEFVSRFQLFRWAIDNALGLVVHSAHAYALARPAFQGPMVRLDLPWQAGAEKPRAPRPGEPLQLVFCGHAGPNRRLRQFIDAWSRVSAPGRFRLALYGHIDKARELLDYAADLGLGGAIDVHGFVDEEELEQALAGAHLALNLRYPTMGEASASQLRYMGNGIPTLVTDVGWYAELPDEAVIKVSPDNEIEGIAAALEALLAGDTPLPRVGEQGRRYVAGQHQPAAYVQGLRRFVAEIAEKRFIDSVFDDGLLRIMTGLCEDVHDSRLFIATIEELSRMVATPLYIHSNDQEPG